MDKAMPSFDDFYVVEGIRAYVCNVYALPQYICMRHIFKKPIKGGCELEKVTSLLKKIYRL